MTVKTTSYCSGCEEIFETSFSLKCTIHRICTVKEAYPTETQYHITLTVKEANIEIAHKNCNIPIDPHRMHLVLSTLPKTVCKMRPC